MPAALMQSYRGGCFEFSCLRFGEFKITTEADAFLKTDPINRSYVGAASGYIRQNQGLTIDSGDLKALRIPRVPTAGTKAARLLLGFAQENPQPGMHFSDPGPRAALLENRFAQYTTENVIPDNSVPDFASFLKWLGIAAANDAQELQWLTREALIEQGYLQFAKSLESFGQTAYPLLVITASGWTEVERLQSSNPSSSTAFVAMSFKPEFIDLYDKGIAPGITSAGFEPLRVDRKEHNHRIDDEIIASIKVSRFLVADFTVDRGGIYFEAGYGLGLGIPVIWLVRESEKDAIHFDNRQYNFIRWHEDNYSALATALRNRIEATIGHGPIHSANIRL
jgi:nucleoside 2-deoxyribosyltransferase